DPEAMKSRNVSLQMIMDAIKGSNIDVGAQTIEVNMAEYFVRGLGYIETVEDIEKSVVTVNKNVPVRISDVAKVSLGPAARRGVLDKSGAEAVGGVVVARYGANPLEVIDNVKSKIKELEPGLASKIMEDGRVSKVRIVPFYDRTQLIKETIGTLQEALTLEILVTVLVVILMLLNLKSSILVSGTLPVAVLMCFIAMKYFGVDANIVALSGIAIAIGTMVDMGIVLIESIVNRLENQGEEESLMTSIYEATIEVASAVITAVATTIISFIPVFTMEAAEGKLFKPLAYTKTFALLASIIVAITIIPSLAHGLFSLRSRKRFFQITGNLLALAGGVLLAYKLNMFAGLILAFVGLSGLIGFWFESKKLGRASKLWKWISNIIYALIVAWLLAEIWMPLGVNKSNLSNFTFIVLFAGSLILLFYCVIYFYEAILRFLLRFKIIFLVIVGFVVYQGFTIYQETGEEFMPSLDEGSFLLMPTSMPHSGMQENIKNLRLLDMAVTSIPEVETVVGKAGRVNSALDPAPMSMYENVILYKSEYRTDENGHRIRFRYENGEYVYDEDGHLIPDKDGRYLRQWRDEIKSPDDIWDEIVKSTKIPGVTSAPKLQPIETRLVMLQTGMRAPMGIKVQGTDLESIEAFGLELERHLKDVDGVKDAAVFADRIVGKPYMLIDIDRDAISRYGLTVGQVQKHIQTAVGGMPMSMTVEGRERYNIRLRYPRELRSDPDVLNSIYVNTKEGLNIPLGDLVDIRYEAGAQSIKSEDGFLIGYVLFDKEANYAQGDVVENASLHLETIIEEGLLEVPEGINYRFAGNYEQQIRANKRLSIVVPVALAIIFVLLYFQFKSIPVSFMVFTGVFIAFAGGFIMIGLYDTEWFMDFSVFGTNMRDLFQIKSVNLSVAVWVGFLALFGIATDDGVLVATFLRDSFKQNKPDSIMAIRDAVVEGGLRRVRPAMMTTATTILALIPVLTSTGRGSDIMIPMAIPSFGGMTLQIITMFTVPVLYSLWHEWQHRLRSGRMPSLAPGLKVSVLVIVSMGCCYTLSSQTLEELSHEMINSNLELKILEKEYMTALEKSNQVSQLPDTEFGLGVFPLPVETRLGAQILRLSGTQMVPWKGVLNSQSKLAESQALPLQERVDARRLELEFELESAFLEIYELNQTRKILTRRIDVLNALNDLALDKVQSGEASAADVLMVDLEKAAIIKELEIIDKKIIKPQSRINKLLNRTPESVLEINTLLQFAEMSFDRDSIRKLIRNDHPMIHYYDLKQEVSRNSIQLNDLSSKPDLGFGLDYIMVDGRSDAIPDSNGRDIIQLRASMKIPLNRKKYESKDLEEKMKIEILDLRKTDMVNQFMALVESSISEYEMFKLQVELYRKQIEITQSAIEILTLNYSTKSEGFDELLRLELELINYDLKMLQAIVKSHLSVASIKRFLNN
ncbi:MAG: CusA/CzcA family heavy metal efflux RND transporter, partial [Saprospiraceae bacterium]|nr:CusA/CzcA family heavy metal efflux RND transporter [Saprospiraceae bacterium]